jgi:hypothetical protein
MFFLFKKESNNSCYSLDQPNKLIFLLDRKKEVMIAKKKKNNHDNSSKKPLSKRKIMILFNFQSIKYERTK